MNKNVQGGELHSLQRKLCRGTVPACPVLPRCEKLCTNIIYVPGAFCLSDWLTNIEKGKYPRNE